MNYFKGLVSNVRGFYSEINSATLTGAIDVVVIQQEDRTFRGSPFHVRFGKLGVLRSREKIVDILINGEPVDLQMKLGDAGEAFFVEEVEESSDIPSELSTTPIPSINLASAIDEKKENADDSNECETPTEDDGSKTPTAESKEPTTLANQININDTETLVDSKIDNDKELENKEDGNFNVETIQDNKIDNADSVLGDREETSKDDASKDNASKDDASQDDASQDNASKDDASQDVASQDGASRDDASQDDASKDNASKDETSKDDASKNNTSKDNASKDDASKDDASKDDASKDNASKDNASKDDASKDDASKDDASKDDTSIDEASKESLTSDAEQIEETQKEDDIEKEIVDNDPNLEEDKNKDDRTDVDTDKHEVNQNIDTVEDIDGNATKEDESTHSYSQSIPIPGRHQDTYIDRAESPSWASDTEASSIQERFRADHLYPFSDLDSPVGSPPTNSDDTMKPCNTQHCLSDTEVEIQQSQENMNVTNQVTWDWGKLPQGPEGGYKHDRSLNDLKRDEGNHGFRSKRKDYLKSHKIKEEGIYLDDLTTIDQEVAALYLNQALSRDGKKGTRVESPTTEGESGIGQSLPSSPTSELTNPKDSSGSETYSNIALSLCGDLKSGKVPLETFMNSLVTFDDLSSNPALLNDPKLVIRINDRYYNWQIAAPMLMSYIAFQRPLKQEAVQGLTKKHMPKKEKRRSYYWFSWRQNYDDQSSDDDDFDPTKEKHRPRVHSGSRKPLVTTPDNELLEDSEKSLEQTEKIERELNENENENELMNAQQRLRNVSECTSGNESDVGYRKTTRLTSEQLAKLNLHDGANTIHFSVTTQYQGTAECQATIYLWNYDDRIVISDIDGTITKSDVLGHILPVVGQAWAQSGVAHFFSSIEKNGYKLLYLSARAIGQAQLTRDYLKSVKQDQITLPDGPLLLSPASLIKAFHREVIEKKPEEFKIAALRDILGLFSSNKKPFYSGFGNKINDVYSYRAVGVSLSRIFTINHKGEVRNELTTTFQSSYLDLQNLVDQMFPPYKKEQFMKSSGLIAPDEFSSFTYWRNPLPDVDLGILDTQLLDDVDIPVTFTS